MLTSFAKTHIGQRITNEDYILVNEKLGLYIVADGVGGLEKGEVASNMACQKIMKCIKKGKNLDYSVYEAHGALVDQIESNEKKQGMATTIAAVLFAGNNYQISWVGDTRVYLWDGRLKLLTKDDSYVERLFENDLISLEDMETHPDRNVISQALGMTRKEITINNNSGTLERNQVLLICSDGLYSIANEANIINELSLQEGMTHLTEKLVNIAVENDGKDNISLISIKSDESNNQQDESIKPHVVREFEAKTGKFKKKVRVTEHEETDPNLVDITELKELTQKEKNLIDSAALWAPKIEEKTNYILPITLFIIILLIATLLYFFR
jgi:serine/threonine protein phosphatase PrpC